ncbi:uncharacterized protein [Rutidosis leptorrhynchoides]|uniref:uncharacterized protein n=1 Tax=Rutidosis leptorrhynchoides TaxID=125765 RepID=UPI003A996406
MVNKKSNNELLLEKFARIFRLDINEDALVSDRLVKDSSSWRFNWEWARDSRGRTATELQQLQRLHGTFSFVNGDSDKWEWKLHNKGQFSTNVFTCLLNEKLLRLNAHIVSTARNNFLPQKVNIFIWRKKLKRLPFRDELDKRGVDLDTLLCPICSSAIECVEHALLTCPFAMDVWSRVRRWWGIHNHFYSGLDDMFVGNRSLASNNAPCKIWQVIEWVCGYILWKNRNAKVFGKNSWTGPMALNKIQIKTFQWISSHPRSSPIEWTNVYRIHLDFSCLFAQEH